MIWSYWAHEHKTSNWMQSELSFLVGPQEPLLAAVKWLKLVWSRHVTCHNNLSKTILQGTLGGGWCRGRQRKCLMDNIKKWTSLPIYQSCSQGPLAEKTERGSLLNCPSCSPCWRNRSRDWTECISMTIIIITISPTVCCHCQQFSSVLVWPYHDLSQYQSDRLLPLSAVLQCIGITVSSLSIPLSASTVCCSPVYRHDHILTTNPTVSCLCLPAVGSSVDTEIKVPSGENTELKHSPFKAWSRSVYSHTCCAYFQGFLPCLFLTFWSIHLHFSKTFPNFSCVGCG